MTTTPRDSATAPTRISLRTPRAGAGMILGCLLACGTMQAYAQPASSFELSSLNGTNGFVLTGADSFDDFGFSVSGVGDVNGDGLDDVIVGAHQVGFAVGASYVVFGRASGFVSPVAASSLDGSNGFVLDGVGAGDFAGWSVSGAGDVNGDGLDDFVIGAREAFDGAERPGAAYVIFGNGAGFSSPFDLSTLNGANGFKLNGINDLDRAGHAVSRAGDVNGDGVDDIIVGAYRADPAGRDSAGETYVVFGNSAGFSSPFELSSLDGSNGFIVNGIDALDESGWSVGAAGDVNGDGVDDIIIGGRESTLVGTSPGSAYVVFGRSSGFSSPLELSSLDGSNGFVVNGVSPFIASGHSVDGVGDVNGDGVDDFIVSAYLANVGAQSSVGESYLVYGSQTGFSSPFEISSLDGSNGFVLHGIDASDFAGYSVSGAGDVNGDGLGDFIIAAIGGDPNGSESGESYLVFGRRGGYGSPFALASLDGINGFVLNGVALLDQSGGSVSGAGDVNGDGLDDIILGASSAGPFSIGASYVVFGSPRRASSSTIPVSGLSVISLILLSLLVSAMVPLNPWFQRRRF